MRRDLGRLLAPRGGMLDDERGSAPVEFVLVGLLLTVLTLGVVQLGLAMHVRNVVHDAAVEGAHVAGLADVPVAVGAERTRAIIAAAVGPGFVHDVRVDSGTLAGQPVVTVTVTATLPLVGVFGIERGLEVTGLAPRVSLD